VWRCGDWGKKRVLVRYILSVLLEPGKVCLDIGNSVIFMNDIEQVLRHIAKFSIEVCQAWLYAYI
ncbi:hypothetical protein J6590_096021, partial [Homalodisca vitripennis]